MRRTSEYEQVLTKLKAEASALELQRQQIDDRLASLKQAMEGINALIPEQMGAKAAESVGKEALRTPGLSDSILEIIRAAGAPLSPREIRDRLVRESNFRPEQYSNFLTTIHNTLHRLVVSRRIGFAEFGGRTVYLDIPHANQISETGGGAKPEGDKTAK